MSGNAAYRDPVYQRAAARLRERTRAEGGTCVFCGKGFDWDADQRGAAGFTAEHTTPLANGGSVRGRIVPAHRGCNSSAGRGILEQRAQRLRDLNQEKHPGLR